MSTILFRRQCVNFHSEIISTDTYKSYLIGCLLRFPNVFPCSIKTEIVLGISYMGTYMVSIAGWNDAFFVELIWRKNLQIDKIRMMHISGEPYKVAAHVNLL